MKKAYFEVCKRFQLNLFRWLRENLLCYPAKNVKKGDIWIIITQNKF